MKKNLTRILMLVSVMVICFSMVLGLAGCGPSGPEAYADAEQSWKEADSKTATDNIKVTVDLANVINFLGLDFKDLKLNMELSMKREYGKDGQLELLEAKVIKAELTGVENLLSAVGALLPKDIGIDKIIKNGRILLNNFVEARIEYVVNDEGEFVYEITGGIYIEEMDVSMDASEGPVVVKASDVDNTLEELGLIIPFDFLSMFDISAGTISKDSTATINGSAALNWITAQALDLADSFFQGTLTSIGGKEVKESDRQIAIDAFEALAGGVSKEKLKTLLDKLFILEDVDATITYDKNGDFDKIVTSNNMKIELNKSYIDDILALDGIDLGTVDISSYLGLLKENIKIGVKMEIETKVKIG